MRRLALKELREHGWIIAVLFGLGALALVGLLNRDAESGGRFAAFQTFLFTFGPMTALVAGNRLVVREYAGKTQLFLEVLPIGRERVAIAKWLFGAAWVTVSAIAAWAATWWWQSRNVNITLLEATYALVPGLLWLGACWAMCFVAGLLGRYRLLFWAVVFLLVYALDEVGQVVLRDTPPFRLVSDAVAAANGWPMASDVLVSGLLIVIGFGCGFALAVAGEGSIASTLSGRMTSRERIISVVTVLVGFFLFTTLTRNRDRPAFALESVTPKDSPAGPIGVLPGEGVSQERAAALVEAVAVDVVSLVQALGLPKLAGVYVVSQRGLDPDVILRVPLGEKDGVVYRANLADPRFDELNLRYRILHTIVSDHTDDRALEEDRHWLLDGLATWWAVRGDSDARALMRRRAAAAPIELSKRSVARWNETFETAGDCFGMGVSFTLVDALIDEVGEAEVLELARATFKKRHKDLRDVLTERSPEAVLRARGVDFDKLLDRAESARRNAGGSLGYRGNAELVELGGGQTRVKFTLTKSGAPVARWRGLTASTGPWQSGVSDAEPDRVDARAAEAMAPGTYAPGERLFMAIEVDDAELRCSARVFQRWEVLP